MSHNSQYGQSVLNVHRKFEVRSTPSNAKCSATLTPLHQRRGSV